MSTDQIKRLRCIALMGLARAGPWRKPDRAVPVRVLRDQPMACPCCGELLSAGDDAILPRALAKALERIGNAVIIAAKDDV